MKKIIITILTAIISCAVCAQAPSGDPAVRLVLLNKIISAPFSSATLERERDEKIKALTSPVKDEFETKEMFEKRMAAVSMIAQQMKDAYDRKIAAAREAFNRRIEEVKQEREELLASSEQEVTSSFTLGTYNADEQEFPLSIAYPASDYKIAIPLSLARDFKSASSSLIAQGKKRMTIDGGWEYYNWSIAFKPSGQSFSFGPQRGRFIAGKAAKSVLLPPNLSYSVSFKEPSGNYRLDAEETGEIVLAFTNSGKGTAFGVEALVSLSVGSGISAPPSVYVGEIAAGKSQTVSVRLTAPQDVPDGNVVCTIKFKEQYGFAPDPKQISFETKALVPPQLTIADMGLEDPSGNGQIEPGEVVKITMRVQNMGHGDARNVRARVSAGENVFFAEGSQKEFALGDMPAGKVSDFSFSIYTNKQATEVPVTVNVSESRGRYGITGYRLPLAFRKTIATMEQITVKGKDENKGAIVPATGLSVDIETNIPQAAKKNTNAVALVLAISDYANPSVPRVTYAKRDAAVMRNYLEKTFGYDPKNILPPDPEEIITAGTMKTYVKKKLSAYLKPDGSSELFIYFVGHGAPSTTEQEAFLVPYDCDPNFVNRENAYAIKQFYEDISSLKAKKKLIVVDACFSGQSGDGKTLVKNASPIFITVDNVLNLDKNCVLFQSSASNQVSNWYPQKSHSMFTYFFLKGVQGSADRNGDGAITADELESYINNDNDGLPYYSNREFQRPQRAVVVGSRELEVVRKGK